MTCPEARRRPVLFFEGGGMMAEPMHSWRSQILTFPVFAEPDEAAPMLRPFSQRAPLK